MTEKSQPMISLSMDLFAKLQKHWALYRNSFGENDIRKMREELRKLFVIFSESGILPQLILVDKEGKIIMTLSTPVPEWTPDIKLSWEKYCVRIVGSKLLNDKSLYRSVIFGDYSGQNLYCERINTNSDTLSVAGGVYSVKKIIPGEDRTRLSYKEIGVNDRELNISLIDHELVPIVDKWLEKMLIIPYNCSESKNLPGVSGALIFSLPSINDEDFLEILGDDLPLLSLFFESITFMFQSFALSQASVERPNRLSEEFVIADWKDVVEKAIVNKSQQELSAIVSLIFSIENIFIRRKLIRFLANKANDTPILHPVLIDKICNYLSEINTDSLEDFIPSLKYISILVSSLRRNSINKDILIRLSDCIRNFIQNIEIERKPHSQINTEMVNLGIQYCLSILEDTFSIIDSEMRLEICETYHALIKVIIKDGLSLSRVVVSLLTIYSHSDPSICRYIEQLLIDIMEKDDFQTYLSFEKAISIFGTLDEKKRLELLNISPDGRVKLLLSDVHLKQSSIASDISLLHDKLSPLELISVISAKGGVGKSTVSLLLASYLSSLCDNGEKVCLIDLDFYGPTINYLLKPHGLLGTQISLNEYIWAKYMPELDRIPLEDTESQNILSEIFSKRIYWKNHFTKLAEDKSTLEQKVCLDTKLSNLKIVLCSENFQLQDLMVHFLGSINAQNIISSILYKFIQELKRDNYKYVIFDCPAEQKELTLIASELSTKFGGKNLFVTTLSAPSLWPIIYTLCQDYYSHGSNYLIINKLRKLEHKYASSKQEFIDYLLSRQEGDNTVDGLVLSASLLEKELLVRNCTFLPWIEHLHAFIHEPRELCEPEYSKIVDEISPYLKFILE